ncbi:MAG: MFS transporter [Bdellovibrionota bacterium]
MIILITILSILFDFIDFSLFIFFPKLVNKSFIGMDSEVIEFSFLAFAIAYLSRSIGACVLIPRLKKLESSKSAIILTGAFVLIPSFLIIILPSYASIGISSYIIFMLLRFLQGFGVGVDFPVTIFYIFKKFNSLSKTTVVFSFGAIGLFFSFYFASVIKNTHLFHFFYQGENWRWLFLAIFMLSLLSLLFRIILKKEAYNNFLKEDLSVFKFKIKQFFYNLLISYLYGVCFYTFFVYLPFFYDVSSKFKATCENFLLSIFITFFTLFLFRKKDDGKTAFSVLFTANIVGLLGFVFLSLNNVSLSYQLLFLAIIIGLYASSFVYCMLCSTTFYTFAIAYNLGQGLASFTAPIIGKEFPKIGLNIYTYLFLFTFFSIFALWRTRHFYFDLSKITIKIRDQHGN